MSSRRTRVAGAALVAVVVSSLFLGAGAGPGAGAATPANRSAASAAIGWLVSRQEPDGGFELADFPGFETPDAVVAVASAAQTTATWSSSEARSAVERLQYGGPGGPTPIDALDDWAGGGINAGEASKLLLLVVAPLGLDPAAFGPAGTNLAAIVYPGGCTAAPDTASLFFQEKMYVAFGGQILCGAPDGGVLRLVRGAQRADGGWNFNGSTAPADPADPFDPNGSDVDTTALAVQALVAGGAPWDDPGVGKALRYLAAQQSTTGAFRSFGSDDPNATAVAMLAIAAAGFDPHDSCWRSTTGAADAGPYAAPDAWIRSQQQSDGRIASPNDDFGVNSFATSQSVEALLRTWLPIARASGAPSCVAVAPGTPEPDPYVPTVDLEPRFTG